MKPPRPDLFEHTAVLLADRDAEVTVIGDQLMAAVTAAARQAHALGRPIAAWTTSRVPLVDPIDLFQERADLFQRRADLSTESMLWVRPDEAYGLVGLGRAWEFTAEGPERFVRARQAWQALMQDVKPMGVPGAGPILMGGFSFAPYRSASPQWDGFPAASLILPRLSVVSFGDASWISAVVVVQPDGRTGNEANPDVRECIDLLAAVRRSRSMRSVEGRSADDPAATALEVALSEFPAAREWKTIVEAAAAAVRRGALKKVVVARGVRVHGAGFDPVQTLRRLRAEYSSCTLFAISRGDRCFVGATPERLIRVRHGGVSAMALAGSAPRGETEEEDRRFGESLLASQKDRIEHTVVVDVLREALSETCASVRVAPSPSLLKLSNVQHLYTPIAAKLHDHATVLDLVGRLHPTPAVGGVPRDDALGWIQQHEGLDRGWYAGPLGWVDPGGEGEFAVAIRSALLHRDEALLYTGCGIMADSNPDLEYAESCLKLRPMLAALGADPGA